MLELNRKAIRITVAFGLLLAFPLVGTADEFTEVNQADAFAQVATIFKSYCIDCHDSNTAKGGLSLHSQPTAMAGGDSGAVIQPHQPAASLLLDYVRGGDDAEMPPEGKKLSAQQAKAIENWISGGAVWPSGKELAKSHLTDRSWWSLQPLKNVQVPTLSLGKPTSSLENPTLSLGKSTLSLRNSGLKTWPRNDIDRFVLKRLQDHQLTPTAPADRKTLIRRVYFDLIGLPPTPAAIDAFEKDIDADAYVRLVDDLLDSERYGERWARHWLDVVHYGDTHGYDKDKLRPNAWPYRDYVIRSFNEDKPWSRFIQEQIAGDVLYPDTRDGIEALGFISAGPWDFVGHAEVSEAKIDGKIARHLDRDDMVRTTMQSFMGLTVGCAQCHDHKFDPIPQLDYYKLHAVFAAIDRADRMYDMDPLTARRRRQLTASIQSKKTRLNELQSAAKSRVADELKVIDSKIAADAGSSDRNNIKAFGYHSKIEPKQDRIKWVQVDLGSTLPLQRIVLRPCSDDFNGIGAGFGFPKRFKIEVSDSPTFKPTSAVTLIADETGEDFKNPKLRSVSYDCGGKSARYVRVSATKLAPRKNDYNFALAELQAFNAKDVNLAKGCQVKSLDSIEAPERWQRQNLTDGMFIGETERLETLRNDRERLIHDARSTAEQTQVATLRKKLKADAESLARLPKQAKVYAGTVHTGNGKFVGTGASGGKPRAIYRLQRGDVRFPREPVDPGALSILDIDQPFQLDAAHSEGQRRAALARWLTDPRNPLPWRNIVNRVWLYHFGRGIVETPNDFGVMGALPTHPQLLDFLAYRFRESGGSLKQLHRLIVTSATYRQASRADSVIEQNAKAIDSDNRFLWKMRRRKLEAESIRDSMLLVSGKLDLKMYGPGYRDFILQHPQHSPHYEYHLKDPNDPNTHRRSIYRFIVRSQNEPFMSTLDCADPSLLVGRRNQSLTPLQSLTLLNNGIVVTMAGHFAAKLESQADSMEQQIQIGFLAAIGRKPTDEERETLSEIAKSHGLANACRLIFNMNEFVFVD